MTSYCPLWLHTVLCLIRLTGVYHKRGFEISMVYQKRVSCGHQKRVSCFSSRIHLQLPVLSLRIGKCPSNSPFLKNNGAETPKGPRPIVFKEWRDTRIFSNLKSTHCTLLIWLIINLITKKKSVYII